MKPPREAKLQGLTPKRRFPEFRDAEEWGEFKLINVTDKKVGAVLDN